MLLAEQQNALRRWSRGHRRRTPGESASRGVGSPGERELERSKHTRRVRRNGQSAAPEKHPKLYALRDGDTDGLVICCSSPSFSEAFHDFIHDELGMVKPAIIMIP